MGIFGGIISGAIGSMISGAANAAKNHSSGSGSSSSSKGGGSSGGGSSGGYRPIGTNDDSHLKGYDDATYQGIQQAKSDYDRAQAAGDTAGMAEAHQRAENLRKQHGYSGGTDGSGYYTFGGQDSKFESGIVHGQQAGYDQYQQQMEAAAEEARRAQEAAVQQSVNNLNAQKGGVQQAGVDANTAAEQAYYDLINPNGANAEAMAARGLSASGLAESSMISAGNARQEALNNNQRSVNEQLAEIDRAIANARLTGDIATAQTLASYRQAVAEAGLQSAQQLANLKLNLYQGGQQNALSEAGLTGYLRGQQTMAGQQNDKTLESMTIENQVAQIQLDLMRRFGVSQQELELEAMRLQNQGYSLANAYQALQYRYASGATGY